MPGGAGPATTFVGRGEVLDALLRRFDEVCSGSAAVTLLIGDSGVGKTTLLSQLVPRMRSRRARVLVGRAPRVDAPLPFSLLQSALDSASEDPLVHAEADPRLGDEPTLVGFVPGMLEGGYRDPASFESRLLDLMSGHPQPVSKSREELLASMAQRFLELTRRGPAVLILEDIPRADRPSLAAVEFFAKELAERPVWVVATARPPQQLPISEREHLERFERATGATRILLRPFTSGEVAEYLKEIRATRVFRPAEIERLHSESGGNPYLLQQIDLAGPLGARGTSPGLRSLPSDGARFVLELTAVLGATVPFPLLLRASGQDEEHLAEEIDRLVALGFLTERSGEILEFSQEQMREEVYDQLPEERRRDLHQRAGVALEADGALDASRVYALAHHFELGRDAKRSVKYALLAAEIAERALAPESAWEQTTRALESHRKLDAGDLDGEADLVLELARITDELGILKEAEEILREFLQRTAGDSRLSATRRAAIEVLLCRVLAAQGNLPATAEIARRVLETPGLADQGPVQIGANHHLGMVLYYEGRYAEALSHHDREIELARRVDNTQLLARAQIWRIANLQMLGRMEEAIAEAREVTAARDRLGSVKESAQAHLFLGDILSDARVPPEDRRSAVQEYATAIRFSEQAKDPRRMGWALYRTSELLREEGRFEDAGEAVGRACHLLGLVGDHVGLAAAIRARGSIAMAVRDLDRAEEDFLEALRLLQGTENTLEEIDTILRLASLQVARKDWESSQRYAADLARLDLPRLRPDLRAEFSELEEAIGQQKSRS